jgi:hypothetical protein
MKVYIYNQNCIMAGHTVPERVLEQHDPDDPDDPDNLNEGDWTVYEGTANELRALALKKIEAAKVGGGNGRYHRQVAETLLDAIGLTSDEISALVCGPEEA